MVMLSKEAYMGGCRFCSIAQWTVSSIFWHLMRNCHSKFNINVYVLGRAVIGSDLCKSQTRKEKGMEVVGRLC